MIAAAVRTSVPGVSNRSVARPSTPGPVELDLPAPLVPVAALLGLAWYHDQVPRPGQDLEVTSRAPIGLVAGHAAHVDAWRAGPRRSRRLGRPQRLRTLVRRPAIPARNPGFLSSSCVGDRHSLTGQCRRGKQRLATPRNDAVEHSAGVLGVEVADAVEARESSNGLLVPALAPGAGSRLEGEASLHRLDRDRVLARRPPFERRALHLQTFVSTVQQSPSAVPGTWTRSPSRSTPSGSW
jgi:hypothetical protein